jgi:hypothetical protein
MKFRANPDKKISELGADPELTSDFCGGLRAAEKRAPH